MYLLQTKSLLSGQCYPRIKLLVYRAVFALAEQHCLQFDLLIYADRELYQLLLLFNKRYHDLEDLQFSGVQAYQSEPLLQRVAVYALGV